MNIQISFKLSIVSFKLPDNQRLKTENQKLKTTQLTLCWGINAHETPLASPVFEFDHSCDLGIERVITPSPDIRTGFNSSPTLANDDRSARDELAAKSFDPKPLSRRIPPVARTSYAFFMCHTSGYPFDLNCRIPLPVSLLTF